LVFSHAAVETSKNAQQPCLQLMQFSPCLSGQRVWFVLSLSLSLSLSLRVVAAAASSSSSPLCLLSLVLSLHIINRLSQVIAEEVEEL
jgi:hypothetical protein